MTDPCSFCHHRHCRPRRYAQNNNIPTLECSCNCLVVITDWAAHAHRERYRLTEKV